MMKNWKQFNEGLFLSVDEWENKMVDFIKFEGAIQPNKMSSWELDTKFGLLYIKFDFVIGHRAIFMRFEEPNRSKELNGVNIHSGKWNLHENNMTELFRHFKMRINEVKLTPVEKTVKKYNM